MSELGEPLEPGLSKGLSRDVRTVAKGGAVQFAGQLSERGFSFLMQIVAIRVLGTSPYGLYRQVLQILQIGAQLGLMGFNYASMRFIALARAREDHGAVRGTARVGTIAVLITSLAVAAAVVVGADPIARLFADSAEDLDDFVMLFRIGVAYIPLFGLLQVWRYCTQAYKTMVPSVIAGNIIQPISRFVLGIAVLIAGAEVAGLVFTFTISAGIAAVAAAFYLRRMMTAEERNAAPVVRPGPMIRFALPQGGSSLLGIQALGLGVLIIGAFESNAQAGLFAIALALQGPGNIFLGGILNIWAPVVSDLHHRGEIERLESMYQTITRWVATFSFPVWAALILEPDMFLGLFAGDRARGAATVVMLLAAGNFFYTGTGPTGYVLSMTGRPGINFVNSIIGIAMYVGGGLWAVPRYGAEGMAAVDAVVTAVINMARVVEAKILVGVQPFGRSMLKPIGATAVGAAALLLWRLIPGDDLWLEATGVVVAGLIYAVVLKAFGMDAEERYVWERVRQRIRPTRTSK